MSAPSHEFVKKNPPPREPLPNHSTMKKTFPKKPNVPLSPSSFYLLIYLGKKTLPSTPHPLNNK